jgi:hypothetical protein
MKFFNYLLLLSGTFIVKIFGQQQCFSLQDVQSSKSLFVYNNNVYDLTNYNHPGGQASLNPLRGNMLSNFVNQNNYSFHLFSNKFYSDLGKMLKGKICVSTTTTTSSSSSAPSSPSSSSSAPSSSASSSSSFPPSSSAPSSPSSSFPASSSSSNYTTDVSTFEPTSSLPTNTQTTTCQPLSWNNNLPLPNFVVDYNPGNFILTPDNNIGLILNQNGGTRISISNIQKSRIDVIMKVSSGMNVVSSIYLIGYLGDQVNFNMVQNSVNETMTIETNFYYRDLVIYDVNAIFVDTKTDINNEFHIYSIIFLEDSYEYLFDNNLLRKISRNDIDMFPDNINELKISIWEASPSQWGGDGIIWNNNTIQYESVISSIEVECLRVDDDNNNNNNVFTQNQEVSSGTRIVVNVIGLILSLYFTFSIILFI